MNIIMEMQCSWSIARWTTAVTNEVHFLTWSNITRAIENSISFALTLIVLVTVCRYERLRLRMLIVVSHLHITMRIYQGMSTVLTFASLNITIGASFNDAPGPEVCHDRSQLQQMRTHLKSCQTRTTTTYLTDLSVVFSSFFSFLYVIVAFVYLYSCNLQQHLVTLLGEGGNRLARTSFCLLNALCLNL